MCKRVWLRRSSNAQRLAVRCHEKHISRKCARRRDSFVFTTVAPQPKKLRTDKAAPFFTTSSPDRDGDETGTDLAALKNMAGALCMEFVDCAAISHTDQCEQLLPSWSHARDDQWTQTLEQIVRRYLKVATNVHGPPAYRQETSPFWFLFYNPTIQGWIVNDGLVGEGDITCVAWSGVPDDHGSYPYKMHIPQER